MKAISSHPVIFYDGVCGLCDRLVRFVLRRDRDGVFRFAALQSDLARHRLGQHGADPRDLDTLYLLLDGDTPDEHLLARSRAVLQILRILDGPWRVAVLLDVLPTWALDWGYRLVARFRYRLFGTLDRCRLPEPEWQDRFLA